MDTYPEGPLGQSRGSPQAPATGPPSQPRSCWRGRPRPSAGMANPSCRVACPRVAGGTELWRGRARARRRLPGLPGPRRSAEASGRGRHPSAGVSRRVGSAQPGIPRLHASVCYSDAAILGVTASGVRSWIVPSNAACGPVQGSAVGPVYLHRCVVPDLPPPEAFLHHLEAAQAANWFSIPDQ